MTNGNDPVDTETGSGAHTAREKIRESMKSLAERQERSQAART